MLKFNKVCLCLFFAAGLQAATALAERSVSPQGASVYIISPLDGETVSSPVKVVFGLSGMGVAPAGTQIVDTGHHHLLIDVSLPDLDAPIPAGDNHRHFGKGQTETELELSSGSHTLQLLLADGLHVPHQAPVFSELITITVQ